jgi:DNA-binding transcriptional regulator YiaG
MRDHLEDALQRERLRERLPRPEVCRSLRETAGLTQADVARAVGCQRASVSRWEAGKRRPRGDLADAYIRVVQRLADEVTK